MILPPLLGLVMELQMALCAVLQVAVVEGNGLHLDLLALVVVQKVQECLQLCHQAGWVGEEQEGWMGIL